LLRRYFFTFLGSQSFVFFADTKPHSLQRKSPGLALRIGFPFWQLMAVSRAGTVSAPALYDTECPTAAKPTRRIDTAQRAVRMTRMPINTGRREPTRPRVRLAKPGCWPAGLPQTGGFEVSGISTVWYNSSSGCHAGPAKACRLPPADASIYPKKDYHRE
jgi:hypothetical protein